MCISIYLFIFVNLLNSEWCIDFIYKLVYYINIFFIFMTISGKNISTSVDGNPETNPKELPPIANAVTDNSQWEHVIPDEFVFKTSIFNSPQRVEYVNIISLGFITAGISEEFHWRAIEILNTRKNKLPTSEYARKAIDLQLVASNQWNRIELTLKDFGNELMHIQDIISSYADRADTRVLQEKKQIIEYFKSVAPSGLTPSAKKHMQSVIHKGVATIPVAEDIDRFNSIIWNIQEILSSLEEKIQWISIEIQSAKAKEGVDIASSDSISFREIAEAIKDIPAQIWYIRKLQDQLRHTMFLKKIALPQEESFDIYLSILDGYMDTLRRNV